MESIHRRRDRARGEHHKQEPWERRNNNAPIVYFGQTTLRREQRDTLLGNGLLKIFLLKHMAMCFLCGPCRRVIKESEGHMQYVVAEKPSWEGEFVLGRN
jgi:hypothetical protein